MFCGIDFKLIGKIGPTFLQINIIDKSSKVKEKLPYELLVILDEDIQIPNNFVLSQHHRILPLN